ncbi:NADPH:quinone reductase-like Zn-dependent oxidoreductase [Leifsonia sp. 563]|uniref:zinc-binding alcohol dehydrogenase family protein n=1 Tax=Leifsonia sp. 563 TaxID=3156412 RepID=UPI00339657BB
MKAAVVTEFGAHPRYLDVEEPAPRRAHEVVAEVLGAAISPRVRSQAAGSHYTSTDELPLIPGLDGVGRTPDGTLRYFILPDTTKGAMAERTVVDLRRSVALPPDADPVPLAAAMNPAMSSWVALRRRARMQPGQSVMVLGASGNAGGLAVQVARRLGAGRVVAVSRDAHRLDDSGADVVVELGDVDALARAASDVDVVLDYLWGRPTADALRAVIPGRVRDDQPLTWVQIGSVAGAESPIPSAALRAVDLRLIGSGQGSVSTEAIVDELSELAVEVAGGAFVTDARAVPLSDVERAWDEAATTHDRLVLVP